MKTRHMHVNTQSRIKKVRVKARCIDFWQQFPSIIMNIRAFILHISIFCDKIFWLVSRKLNTFSSNIFLNSVNEVQILCVLTAYVISEIDKVPSSE